MKAINICQAKWNLFYLSKPPGNRWYDPYNSDVSMRIAINPRMIYFISLEPVLLTRNMVFLDNLVQVDRTIVAGSWRNKNCQKPESF